MRIALGVPPVLGEFQQGDARSGEIEVFSPGEDGSGTTIVRSRLLLRQLGPDDGWFVLARRERQRLGRRRPRAAEVAAGTVTVEGGARGFEARGGGRRPASRAPPSRSTRWSPRVAPWRRLSRTR